MGVPVPRGCDYVVVGSGPSGAVLAWRLSADPAVRVVLLEAGPATSARLTRLVGRFTGWFDPGRRWDFTTVPQGALAGRALDMPQGRALGGATAINAMTYVRGHPLDYEAWAAACGEAWRWERVLAAYKRLEGNANLGEPFHGRDGPLAVSDLVDPHALTRVFVEAGRQAGLRENRDFNGPEQDGVGLYQVTQANGRRRSAADAFVCPAAGRPNLSVLTHALATRVLVSSGRAVGVEFVRQGRAQVVRADAEVIVCGGAINSPVLLLRSGIGPARDLRRIGIPAVLDLPGVGRNLQDHLNVQIVTRCSGPITYDHWDRPITLLRHGLRYLLFNKGLATSNVCEGGAFLRSARCGAAPDIQLHFLPLIWVNLGRTRVDGFGMTLEAAFLRPASRGSVGLTSSDPTGVPRIDPCYCTEVSDLDGLLEALLRGREIMHAPAFRPYVSEELYPGPLVQSRAALARHVREHAISAYHPVGTCRMGHDDLAVVDPELRVRGLEALRVVDSSVIPRITSGSTQAAAMVIGEVGASLILGAPDG